MKTFLISGVLTLIIVHKLNSQAINERIIGYRMDAVEFSPWQDHHLFMADSSRIYYSDNFTAVENPYETYLRLPEDTLYYFINMPFFEYYERLHPQDIYSIEDPGPDFNRYATYGFDSARLFTYSNGTEEWLAPYLYTNTFENGVVKETNFYDFAYDVTTTENYMYNSEQMLVSVNEHQFVEEGFDDITFHQYENTKLSKTIVLDDYGSETLDTINTFEYEYNNAGELVSKIEYYKTIPFSKTLYEYSGLLTKMIIYAWNDANWSEDYYIEFTYEENKLIRANTVDSNVPESWIKNYYYDSYGNFDSITSYQIYEGEQFLLSFETFDFNIQGQLEFYSHDDNIYSDGFAEYYYDYDYNLNDQLISITKYYWLPGDEYSSARYYAEDISFVWNESGSLQAKSTNYIDGASADEEIFDQLNDINAESRGPWYITYFYYEEYIINPAGSETGSVNIHVYPSPADDEINILVSDAEETGIVTIELRNILGELMNTDQIQTAINTSLTIDCRNYHPGVYFVSAHIGGNKSVQKIIVR